MVRPDQSCPIAGTSALPRAAPAHSSCSMNLPPSALALLGLLLAAWTLAAAWAVLWARGKARRAETAQRHSRRLARMVDESPAMPLPKTK